MMRAPSYAFLDERAWNERIAAADNCAQSCRLCPHDCGVNRHDGVRGICRAPGELFISSAFAHHGEEPPLSGHNGSGTVFFSHCPLRCVFCQNYQISHEAHGEPISPASLAERMLWLERQGCHNVNLVTPTHFLPWVLRAVQMAAAEGLTIPIVYNCGGYETPESLELLDGIVDIYLPDMKYGSPESAARYSSAPDYVEINQAAVRAMFRQVGPLRLDENGIAFRGLCIRHLVLPGNSAGSDGVAAFLSRTFDPADITVSLMAQYRPMYKAGEYPPIDRAITPGEYETAKNEFVGNGFGGYYQETEQLDTRFCINFKTRKHEPLTE